MQNNMVLVWCVWINEPASKIRNQQNDWMHFAQTAYHWHQMQSSTCHSLIIAHSFSAITQARPTQCRQHHPDWTSSSISMVHCIQILVVRIGARIKQAFFLCHAHLLNANVKCKIDNPPLGVWIPPQKLQSLSAGNMPTTQDTHAYKNHLKN